MMSKSPAITVLSNSSYVTDSVDVSKLPETLDVPSAWIGRDLQPDLLNLYLHFTEEHLRELQHAASLIPADFNLAHLTPAQFPLPTLRPTLDALRRELLHGRGFALLRGFPVHKYSERDTILMYIGLGVHLGQLRPQNAQGHVLGHVCDLGFSGTDTSVRIYQTHERQTFHTDSCDVVGLLCLRKAVRGGESMLVSAATVYNRMRKERPDLLQVLMNPIATDRRGEVPEPGMLPYLLIPVLNWYQENLIPFYQRQYIESAMRFPDAPRLNDKHKEALDMFDRLMNDPSIHLFMNLEPGDMQFVHNHSLLHDRTSFTDGFELHQKRHLYRLWLSPPGDLPLPDIYKTRYGSIEPGRRGGIGCAFDDDAGTAQLCVPFAKDLVYKK